MGESECDSRQQQYINSFVKREQAFVQKLELLHQSVAVPIKPVLTNEEHTMIFGELDRFIAIVRDLIDQILKDGKGCVGGAFMQYIVSGGSEGEILTLHARYTLQHSRAMQYLNDQRLSEGLVVWLRQHCAAIPSVPKLVNYLILPISIPSRWRVFLYGSLRHNPANSPRIQLAIEKLTGHISAVASQIGDAANTQRLKDLAGSIRNIPPYVLNSGQERLLIHHGELCKSYSRGRHFRHFFLFTDSLMYTKTAAKSFEYKNLVLFQTVESVYTCDDCKHPFSFTVTRSEGSKRTLHLIADTADECHFWVNAISEALDLYRAKEIRVLWQRRKSVLSIPRPPNRQDIQPSRTGFTRSDASGTSRSVSPTCFADRGSPRASSLSEKPDDRATGAIHRSNSASTSESESDDSEGASLNQLGSGNLSGAVAGSRIEGSQQLDHIFSSSNNNTDNLSGAGSSRGAIDDDAVEFTPLSPGIPPPRPHHTQPLPSIGVPEG